MKVFFKKNLSLTHLREEIFRNFFRPIYHSQQKKTFYGIKSKSVREPKLRNGERQVIEAAIYELA